MNKKTQILIAKEVGITQGYLSKIMAGRANPTIATLKKVADAYGISIQSLFKKLTLTGTHEQPYQ